MKRLAVWAALGLLGAASLAWAGKTEVELYPGISCYLSNPEIKCEASYYDGMVFIEMSNIEPKDTVTFSQFDCSDQVCLLIHGPLKSVSAKGKIGGIIDQIVVDSDALSVKMKNFYIGSLECMGLKTAQVCELACLVQSGDGYPKGAVIKAQDSVGIAPYEYGSLMTSWDYGCFGGCIKSISAERIGLVYGDDSIVGDYYYSSPVSTPKKLSLKSKRDVGGCVYLQSGVAYKAKNVSVQTDPPEPKTGDYAKADLQTGKVEVFIAAPEEWSDIDKTRFVWFKNIPAGTFTMGSPADEMERERFDKGSEVEREIKISSYFWMSVFELTEGQYAYVTGKGDKSSTLAKANISYADLRGTVKGAKFPEYVDIDADSFCGQTETLFAPYAYFDLPTEAQWEYACKAGTYGTWNDGSEFLKAYDPDENLDALSWYYCNSDGEVHAVGQKKPNGWGLYDMHGNVSEWCLDWAQSARDMEQTVDPWGPMTGQKRVVKGGDFAGYPAYHRAAYFNYESPKNAAADIGARLVLFTGE